MAGKYRGPMHGIPFALKDIYCTAGIRTTSHSRTRADYVPDFDATTVTKLRRQVPFCSASWPHMSSHTAALHSTCPGHPRAIHGTAITSPVARPAAPVQVSPRA